MYNQIPKMPQNPNYAFAYVPFSSFENLYDVNKALYKGTIFKDLYIPFEAYSKNLLMNPFK